MPLPSSGAIGVYDINVQLGNSPTAELAITGTQARTLAGVPTGAISLPSDFWNKPYSYTFTPNVGAVNEGDSFNVSFSTNAPGSFGYTITGVTSADLSGAALTGTVSNGSVLYFTASADATTEGTETFSISLDNGLSNTGIVTIYDTSVPYYTFTPNVGAVNEGGSFNVSFSTNIGGSFAYTITGVTSADLSGASLTGSVSNGSVLYFTASADATTEGTETFYITLNNGQSNTGVVTIYDTSATPSYGLSSPGSINEGTAGTFTLTTANIGAANYTWYINFGPSHPGVTTGDFDATSGVFSTNAAGTGVFYITLTADAVTEDPNEYFYVQVYDASSNLIANSSIIYIGDTSQTPGPIADFYASATSGNVPFTVNFTDASSNYPTSWAWDFDNNGITDNTAQNPSYTYTNPGTYSVRLTVSNAGGSDDELKINYITAIGYNEQVTGDAYTLPNEVHFIYVTGGVPNSLVTVYLTGGPGSPSQGDVYLDASGNYTFTPTYTTLGTYYYTLYFHGSGNYRYYNVTVSNIIP